MPNPKAISFFSILAFAGLVPVRAEENLRELVSRLSAEIKGLKAEVAQSKARVDELEQKLLASGADKVGNVCSQIAITDNQAEVAVDHSVEGKRPVHAGDAKGSFSVPGTDTTIGVGGFAKLDVLYSSISMGKDKIGNQRLEVAEIPVVPIAAGDNDQLSLHAKESRLWLKSSTPSNWGDMQTYLEMDFLGDAAAYTYTPRLRHAYGALGSLMAGQTWSTFFNSQALADTLDNVNSAGALVALRQPQLRWTQAFSLGELPMAWQLAAEAPRTRIWDGSGGTMTTLSSSHYPDIVGRINLLPNRGNLSLAGLGRHLQFTRGVSNQEKTAWVGAVSIAGKINTQAADNIRFMLGYGNAFGRYAVNNFFADAAVDALGEMEPIVSYSGMLAYQYWWDKAWRSTLAYGFARADQPAFAESANREAQSLHANLLWSPMLQTTIGLEYIYADRELVNGLSGELQRVQFSTRFNF